MNDNMHEYHLTHWYQYRRDQFMEEARRERLKREVMSRAYHQRRVVRLYSVTFRLVRSFRGIFTTLTERTGKRSPRVSTRQEQAESIPC